MADKMLEHEDIADLVALHDILQQDGINVTLQDLIAKITLQGLHLREAPHFKIILDGLAQERNRG
jgi:hypothetical protein